MVGNLKPRSSGTWGGTILLGAVSHVFSTSCFPGYWNHIPGLNQEYRKLPTVCVFRSLSRKETKPGTHFTEIKFYWHSRTFPENMMHASKLFIRINLYFTYFTFLLFSCFVFEVGAHVAQASLILTMQPWISDAPASTLKVMETCRPSLHSIKDGTWGFMHSK